MITIRNAVQDDLPAMLNIYNDVIKNTTAIYDYNLHTREMREEWFLEKTKSGFPVFVAEQDDNVIGFSSIGPFRRPWSAYKYSVENSIYVSKDHRGKGIGKLLLPPLIEAAKQMNMHTIIAGIDATNEASLSLHKNFSFTEVAHFKQVGYKFGKWLDLKFLQLILDTPLNPSDK